MENKLTLTESEIREAIDAAMPDELSEKVDPNELIDKIVDKLLLQALRNGGFTHNK